MTLRLPCRRGLCSTLLTLATACASAGADDDTAGVDSTTSASSSGDESPGSDETLGSSESTSLGHDDSGSSDSTGATDPCTTALGTGPEPIFDPPAGRFLLRDFPSYLSLRGDVSDGPPLELHHEVERSGMCRLLRFEPSICAPACLPPAVCVDRACVTAPSFLPAGDVTPDGVGLGPIAVTEDPFHGYFWDREVETELDMPRLTASGDAVPAFDLSVCPVDAPTPDEDWSAQLEARADGESVTLRWSDPVDTARIYLRMTTGVGTHGGISPVEIECEGPDLGILELPGSYLDALYAEGWSCGECGGNDLARYHADRTEGAEPIVELRVESATNFWHIP
jgi:hypothetical protein